MASESAEAEREGQNAESTNPGALSPDTPLDRGSPLPRWVVPVFALTAATSSVALGRIDQSLGAIQTVGEAAGGIGDIATPASAFKPALALQIIQSWARSSDGPTLQLLTTGYFTLDAVQIVSVVVLLWWWAGRIDNAELSRSRRTVIQVLTGVYAFADLVETSLACFLWCWAPLNPAVWVRVVGWASLTKWLLLGVTVLTLLIVSSRQHFQNPILRKRELGSLLDVALRFRAQLVVVGVLTAVFLLLGNDLGRQVDDVLVRAAEQQAPAFVATLLATFAAAALAWTCEQCARAYEDDPQGSASPKKRATFPPVWAAVPAVVLVGVLICGALLPDLRGALFSFAVVPGAATLFILLSGLSVRPERKDPLLGRLSAQRPSLLSPLLSVAPLVILQLAIVRAIATQLAEGVSPALWGWLALTVTTLGVFSATQRSSSHLAGSAARGEFIPLPAFVAGLAALAAMFGLAQAPGPWWMRLGSPAVLFLWAGLATLVLSGLVVLGDTGGVIGALDVGVATRLPVLSLLMVWSLIAAVADQQGLYYNVRLLERQDHIVHARDNLPDAYARWLRPHLAERDLRAAEPSVVSLVFVSAAGGGIRAAYWTAITWACVFEYDCEGTPAPAGTPRLGDRVFLASSVSGGSLGMASVRSHQVSGLVADWPDEALVADFVAPTLAAFLFGDQLNSIARLPRPWPDRAGALELAWESLDPGLAKPFRAGASEDAPLPHLILNSTSTEDGCRLVVSTVDLQSGNCASAPSTASGNGAAVAGFVRDAEDYLCGNLDEIGELSLASAALTSARFPFVSPAGGLSDCHSDKDSRAHTFALDGGIVDNSGATAVEQAWRQLAGAVQTTNQSEPGLCVVPRLLVIDNFYAGRAAARAPNRPTQSGAPIDAALGAYGARSDRELASAIDVIETAAGQASATCAKAQKKVADIGSAWAVINPSVSPGTQAPLGWTLSSSSVASMRSQLGSAQNQAQVRVVRCWLSSPC